MSETHPCLLKLNTFLPYRMVNLATNISHAFAEIYQAEFGITIPEWRILAKLGESTELNAKKLGKMTFMDKSKVSRTLKLLEGKECVTRQKDNNDNRVAYFSLSNQGRELYYQIVPKALNWERQLINALDASEYRDLMDIMDKLEKRLESEVHDQ